MAAKDKDEVLNTITLLNTIGQEIEDILSANDKDKSEFLRFMGWDDEQLHSITKIPSKKLKLIEAFMQIDGLYFYLDTFQRKYKETELTACEAFKKNKKTFRSLKPMISLLRDDFVDGIDILADIAEFFDVDDESKIFEIAEYNIARYRSAGFEPDTINLFAWLRRGQIDFTQIQLPDYNKDLLTEWVNNEEWKDHLLSREYFYSLHETFKDFGVGLIFTSYLSKTVYGAVRWINHTPLIQISDREKNLATCWYTLFHEIGHVLLHENDDICEGSLYESESKRKTNRKESQATHFAAEHLFGGDSMRKHVFDYRKQSVDDDFIEDTSAQFVVNKMFVAYWMKKAQLQNQNYPAYIPEISFSM